MCNCKPCKCPPNVRKGDKGNPGPAGPAPVITPSILILPAGSEPEIVQTGVSPVLAWNFQLPAAPSPVFQQPVVTQLSPGSPATASITGTPLAPILNLGLASGANGQNGWGTAFSTLDSFTMPVPGFATPGFITIGDNRMVEVGTWVKSAGIGGSWFIVASKSGDDQITLLNPGTAELAPYWGGSAVSIPTNATPTATFSAGTLFVVVGAPGLRGIAGQNGATPAIAIVYTVPTDPPASPEIGFVYYSNAIPPAIPTVVQPYAWDGAAWIAGPNIMGPRGTIEFFQASDPNLSQPSGSRDGDVVIRQSGSTLQYYRRIVSGTWDLVATFALTGTATQVVVQGGPGNYPLDLSNFSIQLEADKPIQLNWDDSNYAGQGVWTVSINNVDAAPIALTYASGQWEESPSVTLPSSIVNATTLIIRFVKNTVSGKYIITEAFVPAAV